MNRVRLSGLSPEPLLEYLAAIGVFRLIARQKDRNARCRWEQETLVISTVLDQDSMVEFFMTEWVPTPIVTPWNSNHGLRLAGSTQRTSEKTTVRAIKSDTPRLEEYRVALAAGRRILEEALSRGWVDSELKPATHAKSEILELCRSRFPDSAIEWMDAAVVLTDDKPVYPNLLGTGGNLGRLELAPNHLDRVLRLVGLGKEKPESIERWLRSTLYGRAAGPLLKDPVAQYDPGGAGGSRGSHIDDSQPLANPWTYVLALEGALEFASGMARRFGHDARGVAAIPFSVGPTTAGYTTATDNEGLKGEFWAPLWSSWLTVSGLDQLCRDGRAEWSGNQARSGLDLARAAAAGGVDNRIGSFVRYVFAERFGQMQFAVPAGRVSARSSDSASLLADLDEFLHWAHRLAGARSVVHAIRGLEEAQFRTVSASTPSEVGKTLLDVLRSAAVLERALCRSAPPDKLNRVRPPSLNAARWLPHIAEDSSEFAIALALASSRDHESRREGSSRRYAAHVRSMASMLRPISTEHSTGHPQYVKEPLVSGVGQRPLVEILADASVIRAREVANSGQTETPDVDLVSPGIRFGFDSCWTAKAADVAAYTSQQIDPAHLGQILDALLMLDRWSEAHGQVETKGNSHQGVDPALGGRPWWILAPFSARRPIRLDLTEPEDPSHESKVLLLLRPDWPARLRAGDVNGVTTDAALRLRTVGIETGAPPPAGTTASTDPWGRILCGSLLIPMREGSIVRLLSLVSGVQLNPDARLPRVPAIAEPIPHQTTNQEE